MLGTKSYPLVVVAVVVVLVAMNKCGKRDEGNSGNPSRSTKSRLGLGLRVSPLILNGAQSGLQTHPETTEGVTLCVPMKGLTAFLELESAIRPCGELG